MKFVHLHVHSHYSLLDGLTKIDEMVEFAKADGAPAVALTDHGVMYGVIDFFQKCKKAGIKPIIGVEAYMAPGSRHNKISRDDEKKNYHLLLLAKDNVGYQNLIKLTSIAHLEGFYYKPRIDWEVLEQHKEGLIACSACLAGEIPYLLRIGKEEEAKKRALEFKELFGRDNYYFEIQDHPALEEQVIVNKKLIELSKELDIPLVATNDVHYLKKEDNEAQDILLCMQNKKRKSDDDRMSMMDNDFSFRPTAEMVESFKHVPEAIENTVKIAEMCNVDIELGNIQLPFFKVPDGYTEASYFRKLCEEGMEKRFGKKYEDMEEEYKERMDYELSVIERMGWPSYFLIVADFVNWAKDKGIIVGPGRGSAAGSFVCFLTGITNLDPIKYDLLFERFLNPDRISMPDIDLDFADVRRGEVIKYVEDKYGKDHVAQIITFGTMAARAAVKDVGRVLEVPYEQCDTYSKAIPMFTTLDEALESAPDFKTIYANDPTARMVVDYAKRLEGVARHCSTHACGVLITRNPLTEYTPVQFAASGDDKALVSQYSLNPVEALGLLKMDFLGLKNLTIIESAIRIIKNTRGVDIDIENIPLDDDKAYKLFQDGETTGVFQFESSGMKRYLRELKPTEFEDIIAMVALYRPGPMEWIPDYIAGKHGKKKVSYLHPKLEPILNTTYGVAIYQEQVMRMARDLAGFSMGEADVLRKAMGKKIVKLLEEQKEKFYDGCVKNGISLELAQKIFTFIEPFAGYGFNRSHAACYALVAYQTAYLKAHWPTEFMAALLTADQQNTDRISVEIEECQRMGIEVKQPDVNQSFESFTVVNINKGEVQIKEGKMVQEKEVIRFGLNAVKNIGEHIAKVLIEERKNKGEYKDLSDLLERIQDKDLNRKSLEAMIKSGAFDKFGERGMLLANVDNMLSFNKEVMKQASSNQGSLFASAPGLDVVNKVQLVEAQAVDKQDKLKWEKELLGLYITAHPFSDYKKYLKDHITPIKEVLEGKDEDMVNVAGIITRVQKIITRNGKAMAFVKIEDETGGIEVLIFPNLYKDTRDFWEQGRAVFGQGKLSDKDQEIKLLANSAFKLTFRNIDDVLKKIGASNFDDANGYTAKTKAQSNGDLRIKFSRDLTPASLELIKEILMKHKGNSKVFFEVGQNGSTKVIETAFRVNNTSFLITALKSRLGDLIQFG
jgi:DNA polymerase-3 subunit alpha